ncbi:hypothetical protein TRFO_21161 [Tritrichomonas foetus]|uniref:Myb-like DNA-binding domain containing protein n=1 Tax=Tritrichomonas foetus TaxID=1144522 RepID=A0A1J4KED7_9EUKA|nr:hypothetical protein TRFO_21161 [Tritrichomonas foetus]|eukprot:OHT09801.1 hypothetical protein TRFO_21161 [Tritrichomonas foetus]
MTSNKQKILRFSPEEDENLCRLVVQYGAESWSHISKFMNGRSARQCRDRYQNYLKPGFFYCEWSKWEDALIYRGYMTFGPQWSLISKVLPGRTANSIKNRWNYYLVKKFEQGMPNINPIAQNISPNISPNISSTVSPNMSPSETQNLNPNFSSNISNQHIPSNFTPTNQGNDKVNESNNANANMTQAQSGNNNNQKLSHNDQICDESPLTKFELKNIPSEMNLFVNDETIEVKNTLTDISLDLESIDDPIINTPIDFDFAFDFENENVLTFENDFHF